MKDQSKSLGGSQFLLHKEGVRAVILFPSLATPGLVRYGSTMQVIIAVHEDSVESSTKQTVVASKGVRIDEETARLFHSHLRFMDWGGNYPARLEGGNAERQYMSHIWEIKQKGHMIYHDHMAAVARHKLGEYRGWCLGKLPSKSDFLLHVYDKDGLQHPFGILHAAAVNIYSQHGYSYLFQLDFENFERFTVGKNVDESGLLKELVWLYLDHDKLAEISDASKLDLCCSKPNDEVLLPLFDEIMMAGLPYAQKHSLPVHAAGSVARGLPVYQLHDASWYMPSRDEKNLESEKGFLFTSRHPVFISNKERLKLGAASDLHLSIRQSLYVKASPRVIHDVRGSKDGENASENIGEMSHNFFSSSRSIMHEVASQSDILLIPGDLFDFCRNTNPEVAGEVENTGRLWDILDFEKFKDTHYSNFIDLLGFIALVYERYAEKTPVYFISGNHDGYKEPYGISPRLHVKSDKINDGLPIFDFLSMNEGIPADHNLTYYEAVLLYGKKYASFYNITNFDREILGKVHCLLTPWKDCLVSYGATQNLILLGWENSEAKVLQAFTYDALPRASDACTAGQLALVDEAVEQRKKTKATNILCSHFTYASFTTVYPFLAPPKNKKEPVPNAYGLISGTEYRLVTDTATDTSVGTFFFRRSEMCEHIYAGNIQYTISGHSHRAGVYKLGSMSKPIEEYKQVGDNSTLPAIFTAAALLPENAITPEDYRQITLPKSTDHAILVCGSAGCYSRQNLRGEFGGIGLDKPQGLTLDTASRTVNFVPLKGDKYKPRLAVLMDYLWFAGVRPFSKQNNDSKLEFYCPTGSDHYAFTPTEGWVDMFGQPHNVIQEIWLHKMSDKGKYISRAGGEVKSNENGVLAHSKQFFFSLNKSEIKKLPKPIQSPPSPSDKQSKFLYFVSVHFAKNSTISKTYNVKSPWCFPVKIFTHATCGLAMYRGGVNSGEIPDFKSLSEIPEYDAET